MATERLAAHLQSAYSTPPGSSRLSLPLAGHFCTRRKFTLNLAATLLPPPLLSVKMRWPVRRQLSLGGDWSRRGALGHARTEVHTITHLYMEMFSISSFVPLSFNTIPLGETFRVTFCSFFPLAFAFGRKRGRGKLQAFNTDTSKGTQAEQRL